MAGAWPFPCSGRLVVVPPDADIRLMTAQDAEHVGADAWEGQNAGRWSVLTAWLEGRLVGSGMLRWEGPFIPDIASCLPGQVEVGFLQVTADQRGRGIGTALIELAEAVARDRGVPSLGLAVGDDNARARGLYERLGYRDTGLRYTLQYEAVAESGRVLTVVESGHYVVTELA
jgi:ribosomal protein S18 acetylase RimI-like enzyme